MKKFAFLTFFCGFLIMTQGIYLDNSTKVKIETNPAIWTEEGIWGPILEDWATGNQRLVLTIKYFLV